MSKEKPLNPLTMTDEELIEHCDKQVQALRMALDMIECEKHDRRHVRWAIVDALKEWKPALAEQPTQRTWVGLTDEEIESIFNNWPIYHLDHEDFARVIEAKLRSKNT